MAKDATEMVKGVGDCAIIAFYYLLRLGGYTVKKQRNKTKQTVQFKLEDTMFFSQDAKGHLRQLPINVPDKEIFSTDGETLKLDNKKNRWKGVRVYQEHNGYEKFILVRALGRRCVSTRKKFNNKKTYLSAYWVGGRRKDINADNMSAALKFATTALNYSSLKGIPIDRLDTHSLRSGGANALLLAGYSDRGIQKMGIWIRGNFK